MPDYAGASPERKDRAPLVTIAMPIYNAGCYLRPAVASILKQTFPDWELIIIDDGSTDDAAAGLHDLHDPRIRLLRDGRNKGLAARLNEAIDLAAGRYFARMDQDDISYPERLARQLAVLEGDPGVDLVAVRCVAIDAGNVLVGALPFALTHEEICARPWRGFHVAHPTWMGRTEWFRRHRYAAPGPYLCEDQELLLRSYLNSCFATVPEILFAYRVRGRIDWWRAFRTRKTWLRVQLRYFLGARQWHYALFSLVAFAARVVLDTLNVLIQGAGGSAYIGYRIIMIGFVEQTRWSEVLSAVGCSGGPE